MSIRIDCAFIHYLCLYFDNWERIRGDVCCLTFACAGVAAVCCYFWIQLIRSVQHTLIVNLYLYLHLFLSLYLVVLLYHIRCVVSRCSDTASILQIRIQVIWSVTRRFIVSLYLYLHLYLYLCLYFIVLPCSIMLVQIRMQVTRSVW